MAVRRVLAFGLLAIAVAFAVLLVHREPRRAGTDLTPNANFAAVLNAGEQTCQGQELLPADTAAVRMTIGAYGRPGPRLSVRLTGPRGEPLTSGVLPLGWRQGVVEIPLAHVSTATAEASVCLRDDGPGRVALAGDSGDQFHEMQVAGRKIENARLLYEYMRPGRESWLQLLPTVVYRFSLGKSGLVRHWAWAGALVLMLLAIALAMRTILRASGSVTTSSVARRTIASPVARVRARVRALARLLPRSAWAYALVRRVPKAAWICALVALANGLAWSLIVPPFQVPDENAHYAYVAQVAERGTVPRPGPPGDVLSPAEDATLEAIGFYEIVGEPHNPAPFSAPQQHAIEAVARDRLSTRGDGDALTATNNPPLYYALEAIPYKLGSSGDVLDRLALMRVLSALMGAVTVLLVYLFLMELLPGRRWAWSVGALAAAFQPLFGFISGGVNSDNLIYLTAAGTLWALARMFRRGLTPASGARIGVFLGLGLVTKFTLIGFLPAVALALALGLWRARPAHRPRALRGAAWAVGTLAAPVLVYLALNRLVWKRGAIPAIGGVSSVSPTGQRFSFAGELSHIWQLFLPPLGMRRQFAYLPLARTWFKGFIGRFGWLDYTFPGWAYRAALIVVLAIVALAVFELVRRRRVLAGRLGELAVYALALVGVCVEIGVESYREAILSGGLFEQARYLLPLLCLYAAIVALAARAGGRRFGPAIGAALVMVAIGHDLLAQAITIARYYA